jgi:pimeloyl-ACP methyl ester carboxylesterase
MVRVEVDGVFLSCLLKKGTSDAIVFVHGLGSSKEAFSDAFRREEFQSFTLLAVDLVGFGDSDKPDAFSYTVKDQARILKKTLDQFGVGRFHLVGHSMGGIVGVELCEMMPDRVRSFINAEGNLTAQDATMSREIVKMNEEEFAHRGFEQFKRDLKAEFERTGDRGGMLYLEALDKATARSVYQSSVSTVYESDHGGLLTRFTRLPFYKCYIYGEKNKGKFVTEKLLKQKGVPVFYISESGHAMMNDNPDEFYDCVLETIRRCEHSDQAQHK